MYSICCFPEGAAPFSGQNHYGRQCRNVTTKAAAQGHSHTHGATLAEMKSGDRLKKASGHTLSGCAEHADTHRFVSMLRTGQREKQRKKIPVHYFKAMRLVQHPCFLFCA